MMRNIKRGTKWAVNIFLFLVLTQIKLRVLSGQFNILPKQMITSSDTHTHSPVTQMVWNNPNTAFLWALSPINFKSFIRKHFEMIWVGKMTQRWAYKEHKLFYSQPQVTPPSERDLSLWFIHSQPIEIDVTFRSFKAMLGEASLVGLSGSLGLLIGVGGDKLSWTADNYLSSSCNKATTLCQIPSTMHWEMWPSSPVIVQPKSCTCEQWWLPVSATIWFQLHGGLQPARPAQLSSPTALRKTERNKCFKPMCFRAVLGSNRQTVIVLHSI